MAAQSRLVADIGGTNCRLALYDGGELREVRDYVNREHGGLAEILHDWLESLPGSQPETACLAVAAPPFEDRVTMLNIDWTFSLRELERRFGFRRLTAINDFQSNAYALAHLQPQHLHVLHEGERRPGATLATVGPGTGLGGATVDGAGRVRAGEPGHMGLSPGNALELELLSTLMDDHGEVHAEYLLSGAGLRRLHVTLAQLRGEHAEALDPTQISQRAVAGKCPGCEQALATFCALLGSVCGDFALANGAYGGLYLAGGILPQVIPFLERSEFVSRFQGKGEVRDLLRTVPLQLIVSGRPGLLGAAHAPLDRGPDTREG